MDNSNNQNLTRYIHTVLAKLSASGGGGGDEPSSAKIEFVDTLPTASEDTVGIFYVIPNPDGNTGTIHITQNDGSTYSWVTVRDPETANVQYTQQTLTEAQKQQARNNIDAASLADIENLDYVTAATLPTASAETMGHVYLIGPDASNNYQRYYTQQNGSSYSWVDLGSTQLDLSTYATEAEVIQLEAKVDENDEDVYEKIDSYVHETESDEYSELLVDAENKILESRDGNGKKTFYCDVEFEGQVEGDFPSPFVPKPVTEYVDAVLDEEDKMVEATTKDGKKVFFGGISMPDGTIFKPKLYGKKWAVLGDSFSNGSNDNGVIDEDGKYKGYRCVYPYIVGNRTGLNVLKFFEGGRTLAMPETPGDFVNSVCNPLADYYYQNIPADVDYITIYLGINDHHHAPGSDGGDGEDNTGEIPLGTPTDNTTATYYGAWNVVLSWLRENRPFAHIGIIVSNGIQTDADYMNAQIAMAKKYGYPYLNLNGDERCPAMIRTANPDIPASVKTAIIQAQALDYPSNTHPNGDAHLFESTFIENFLKSL